MRNMQNCEHCQPNSKLLLTTTAAPAGTTLFNNFTMKSLKNIPKSSPAGGLMADDAAVTALAINTTDMIKSMRYPSAGSTAATTTTTTSTTAMPATTPTTTTPTGVASLPLTTIIPPSPALCQHLLQPTLQNPQRCSSVGSTTSSICETVSSDSGLAMSPTEPQHYQLQLQHQQSPAQHHLTTTSPLYQQQLLQHHHHHQHQHHLAALSSPTMATTKTSRSLVPSNASAASGLAASRVTQPQPQQPTLGLIPGSNIPPAAAATASLLALAPSPIQPLALPSTPSALSGAAAPPPTQQQQQQTTTSLPPAPAAAAAAAPTLPPLVGGLGAAAMAANLAESFSLLRQQANHFQELFYAAQILGRGYYQPAGPLISPHVIQPVTAGPPPPPSSLPPNVPLLATTNTKIKSQTQSATVVDGGEHLPAPGQPNASPAEGGDSELLLTGGDLAPYRYPPQSGNSSAAAAAAAAHHNQQQQQQQHQLHQQAAAHAAAAAAAAAAAHQSPPYPRSMHAQMHYAPAYPASYYSPYPGEPMCYSPPAYQPYFPTTKVYQSAPPPPPHHSAYRRYPYYQPGHPPPPSDLYEQGPPPPPPNSAGSTGGQVAGPPPPPSQAGQPPPPPPPGGTQLVPAGPPAGHSQHLDHYAGPQGYYAGYGTGSSAAGQCYTRSIQAPYMEYPPQCPCPMQQSCPKNVHTGPHIGSNSSSSNNNSNIVNNSSSSNCNSNSNVNHSLNGSSSNNNTSYNHHSGSSNNSTSTVASMSNNHCSSNNNNSNTLNVLSLQQQQQQQQHNNKSQTNDSTMTNNNNNSNRHNNNTPNANNNNAVNTNRGPVKNIPNPMEPIPTNPNKIPLLTIAVKTELAVDDTDNKSQYEENVVTPLTPPDCYSTNEDKLRDTIDTDHVADIQDQDLVIDKTANSAEMEVTSHLRGIAAQVQPIEAYDLTTSTPPLANGVNASVPIVGATNSPHMNTVGRKARIGKSMARNMVYAANQVSSANPPGVQQPPQPVGVQSRNGSQPASPLHSSNASSQATTTPLPKTSITQKVTKPEHNGLGKIAASPSPAHYLVHNVMTKQEIDEVHAPLLLKAEIKSEKIKLEDEQLIDTMLLQQQQHVAAAPQQALSQQLASQKHIIQEKEELKVIKAEPITLSEILHESKVKVELDCEIITPHEERKVAPNCSMGEGASKSQGRMRLLSSRHCLPATARSPLPAVNCDIDLSTTSDDEVLDLCHSPVAPKCSGKRRGILEINKNQCKKSPPNSYKSLIKQAEPKTYLCLSRKFEKKSRFGRIHCSKSPKGSAALNNGIRRRELMLTDQQKESLRNRKKKLAAMEKRRRETKEQRRAELRQKRRKEAKEASNQPDIKGEEEPDREEQAIKKEEAEEDEVVNLVEDEVEMLEIQKPQPQLLANNNEAKSSPQITPKPSPKRGKPAKKPAIPLHLMETIDAVARGYFSEPECRTSSSLVTTTTSTSSPSPLDIHKSSHTANESKSGRSPLAHKIHKKSKTTSEKRSKSETKKPLKVQNAINSEPLNVRTVFDAVPSLTATTSKSAALASTTHITASDPSIEYLDQNRCKSAEPKQTTKSAKEGKSKKSKVEQKSSKKSKSKERHSMENNSMDCVAEPVSSAVMETNNNEIPKEVQILNGEPPEDTKSDEKAEQAVDGSKEMVTELDGEQHNASSVVTLNAQTTPELPDAGADADLPSTTEHTSLTEHSNGNSSTTSTTPTPQQQQQQQLFIQPTLPPMPRVVCHHHGVKRNRSRSKFGNRKRQKLKHSTVSFELDETLPPATRNDVVPKWNNGWTWEGEQFQGAVFLNSDDPLVIRTCYPAMRHVEGDIIRTRDCVLLKANEDNELPYVAKVAHLWENPEDGEMMMSLLWYYRPEHTEQGRQPSDSPDEVYASRHRDHNSVACIEDKCYVLTFSEYCRYRRRLRAAEEDIEDVNIVPKRPNYYSIRVVPENTNPELVMFCRRAYEFRTRRLLKMPNKQDYYVVNS